jgi:hypothetical protein
MKLDIDYTNDPRWSQFDREKTDFVVPNVFLDVILKYKERIPHLQDIEEAVETGTFMGNTAQFFAAHFNRVYTVEKNLTDEKIKSYKQIRQTNKNIEFYHGSSDKALETIIQNNPDTTFLFLLDAHDEYESPLTGELNAIFKYSNKRNHVILIDDCYDLGYGNWPNKTQMYEMLNKINNDFVIENTKIGRDIYIAY